MLTKICTGCKKELGSTIENFHKSSTGKNGLAAKCKSCYKAYCDTNKGKLYLKNKKYRDSNSDHVRMHKKQWADRNSENIKKRGQKYYVQNKEKINIYQTAYNKINSEHRNKISRTWREDNRDKWIVRYIKNKEKRSKLFKDWSANNKIKICQYSQRRRAMKKSLPADFSEKEWNECRQYFSYKCAYCGKVGDLHQDHFLALSRNGEYTKNNIIPSCQTCNSSKGKKDFFEWYRKNDHYSKVRENRIIRYLNYLNETIQQISF